MSDKNSNQLARIHTTTTVHHKAAKSLRVHVQTKKPYSVCLEPTCFEAARGISSAPTHRYFGATWSFKCPVGCQAAGTLEPLGVSNALRAAKPQVLWSHWGFKCPAGCQTAQPAGTLEPLGASNALRAAKPRVLWSHLELEMICGLPTRRYFGAKWCFKCHCGLPSRRCFGATWCFKCPEGCQPASTLEPLGASNALQAAKP